MSSSSVPQVIAISGNDVQKWGCPYCGYRSGYTAISGGGTSVVFCGECKRSFAVLAQGVEKSTVGFADFYPKLQEHPRKGIPAHGKPDMRPEGGGEFFWSRGIGLENCDCFVCGTRDRYGDGTGHFMLNNIAAFVQCKAAGERVVAMFSQGAYVDYRDYEPDRVQVKIGACDQHLKNLQLLEGLCIQESIIKPEMVSEAMK